MAFEGSYSSAARCSGCTQRALIDQPGAEAMVNASFGNLEAFACPFNDGMWHVWYPKVETTRPVQP